MNYLIIKNNTIIQVCTSTEDLLKYLEVSVTNKGVVEITNDGRQLPTCYNMEEFTKEEENKPPSPEDSKDIFKPEDFDGNFENKYDIPAFLRGK